MARHDLPQPSQQFLDELVKHDKFILDCCLRLCKDKNDAQDLRQDVYMKALRFCDGYQEGTNMKGWLVSISKNTYINRFKKKGKSVEVSVESIAEPGDYADYIDEKTFLPPTDSTQSTRGIVAGWVNSIRLLDNMPVKSEQK